MGFGLSGATDRTSMLGADATIAYVDDDTGPTAVDYYLSGYVQVTAKTNISVGGEQQRLPVTVALKFTMHVVQSFIKGHRKSGVISMKHSRDITHRISPLTVE